MARAIRKQRRQLLPVVLTASALNFGCQTLNSTPPTPSTESRHTREKPRGLLVVAPHPDDEALIASGAILNALRAGNSVTIAILTNGDFDCRHSGLERQNESIRGLATLGVSEEQVVFLGYPDGHLARLGKAPLAKVRRRERDACQLGATTYGTRGLGRADYHSFRYGHSAEYTRRSLVGDLSALLRDRRPSRVIVTHPEDTHPDHAAAYTFVRQAIDTLDLAPALWSAIVHNGDCWPTGDAAHEPCPPGSAHIQAPTPPLSGELSGYRPTLRLRVPAGLGSGTDEGTLKVRAIAAHRSQTRGDRHSYLYAFARRDEPFFVEHLLRAGAHFRPVALPRPDAADMYGLAIDPHERSLRLTRARARVLKHWPLPHDLDLESAMTEFGLEVVQVQEDPVVLQISVRAQDLLLGAAIDVFASQEAPSATANPN